MLIMQRSLERIKFLSKILKLNKIKRNSSLNLLLTIAILCSNMGININNINNYNVRCYGFIYIYFSVPCQIAVVYTLHVPTLGDSLVVQPSDSSVLYALCRAV